MSLNPQSRNRTTYMQAYVRGPRERGPRKQVRPMKSVLFVTGHVTPDRVGAFAALHESEGIEVVLFGGRSKHGGGELVGELPFPHRYVRQHEPARLAASGAYRAVVCSTGGRVALPATWAGARRGRVPLILWTSLWAHPRSAAHMFSYLALLRLYRSADAVVTYGPHVSAYVRARGARNVHVAPQAVDNTFWSAPVAATPCWPTTGSAGGGADRLAWPETAGIKFMFAGRSGREKGVGTLLEAWRRSGLQAPSAALVLVGLGSSPPWVPVGGAVGLPGVSCIEPVPPERLREMYADADVLVVPSIKTSTFREPWGLVVNEAMNRGLAIIASDAVGAVAGGLVRDGHNGLVVPAGDSAALADAMVRLTGDPELRVCLGEAAARDVSAYTYAAWADGFSRALATVGLSRTHC
jgi:glycosyltransferase involved in cell wall biosynthesis